MNSDLFKALEAVSPQEAESLEEFRTRLREQFEVQESRSGGALAAANLYRLRLGIELLGEQPPKGKQRLKWQQDKAVELGFKGRGARIIRELLGVAEAVQEAKTADLAQGVPIQVLHRRFGKVRGALKRFLECGDPEGDARKSPLPTEKKKELAAARLERSSEHAAQVLGSEWLVEWLQRKQKQLQEANGFRPPARIRRLFPTPLPYLGSKRRMLRAEIIPRLSQALEPDMTFIEPYVGGGSVFLNVLSLGLAEKVRINDKDQALADFWTVVIQDPGALMELVDARTVTDDSVREYLQGLKDIPEMRCDAGERSERAYRKLVAHACTYAAKGPVERVPYPDKVIRWNATRTERRSWIRRAHALLKGRVVGNECTAVDALDILAKVGLRDLVYLDPPYWSLQSSKTPKTQYIHGYTAADHQALRDALRTLKADWLLTYSYPDDPKMVENGSPSKFWGERSAGATRWHTDLIPDLYRDESIFCVRVALLPRYSAGHMNSRSKGQVGPRELIICPARSREKFRKDADEVGSATGLPQLRVLGATSGSL